MGNPDPKAFVASENVQRPAGVGVLRGFDFEYIQLMCHENQQLDLLG